MKRKIFIAMFFTVIMILSTGNAFAQDDISYRVNLSVTDDLPDETNPTPYQVCASDSAGERMKNCSSKYHSTQYNVQAVGGVSVKDDFFEPGLLFFKSPGPFNIYIIPNDPSCNNFTFHTDNEYQVYAKIPMNSSQNGYSFSAEVQLTQQNGDTNIYFTKCSWNNDPNW